MIVRVKCVTFDFNLSLIDWSTGTGTATTGDAIHNYFTKTVNARPDSERPAGQ